MDRSSSDLIEEAFELLESSGAVAHPTGVDELLIALTQLGATSIPHANDRDLLKHLRGTYDIVQAWALPLDVQYAALFHSIYATPRFTTALVARSDRDKVRNLIGAQAEELVYCFSQASYEAIAEAVIISDGASPVPVRIDNGNELKLSWEQLGHLAFIHIANLADQVTTDEIGPGRWLARGARLSRALQRNGIHLPDVLESLAGQMTPQRELRVRLCYVKGVNAATAALCGAADELRAVAALAPIGEPLCWLALLAMQNGDSDTAAHLAKEAQLRFRALGTAWDKRWSIDEWMSMLHILQGGRIPPPLHRLLERSTNQGKSDLERRSAESPAMQREQRSNVGQMRFNDYINRLRSGNIGKRQATMYPGLPQTRLYDPKTYPIVAQLEGSFEQIRREFSDLHGNNFHREGESIPRVGSWDVYMLYERGKRLDENCDRCPTLSSILNSADCVRSMSGLIYFSRLAPHTRIGAHYGPTNLRIRCHMGISIPKGNCGLEVNGERYTWTEGKCIVFDDSFEHCAWNETDEDRIVLIVDLWHPALTRLEIDRLEGMQSYTSLMAQSLAKYWSNNSSLRQKRKKLYD